MQPTDQPADQSHMIIRHAVYHYYMEPKCYFVDYGYL